MTVAWGGVQVRLRFTWRQRLGAWYLDIFELADVAEAGVAGAVGDPIVLGKRISPRWAPLLGLVPWPQLPPSREVFAVVDGLVGGDPYRRTAFGEAVRLLLLDEDEVTEAIGAIVDPASSLTVVLT